MKSYVYCITCLVNGKRYVGKANDPVGRWRDHLKVVRNVDSAGLVIHQAIRKHGEENFKFEVVSEHETEKEAFEAERCLIREWGTMDHGYNLNEGGEGGFNPSDETRAKLSAVHKGRPKSEETRQKMSAARVGKKLSEETKQKIRAQCGWKHTDESRLKMSLAQRGHSVSDERRRKSSETQKGRKFSSEHRAKLATAQRLRRQREREGV